MDILKKIDNVWREKRLISKLYTEQEAVVRVAEGGSKKK